VSIKGCHDTQHNDIRRDCTQHNGLNFDVKNNDSQDNAMLSAVKLCFVMPRATIMNDIMLSVIKQSVMSPN
jgi:hypothetical protein